MKKRYDGLDGLRTYAILGIVIMHVLANGSYMISGYIGNKIIPSFSDFVYLFMMVSAFGMCCGYFERIRNGRITVDEFFSKRYAKIWPFFACLCIIDVALSPNVKSFADLFANLTLCYGLLPNVKIGVIGVGWTLGVIFVFYLLFPYYCFILGNKKRAWLSFVVTLIFNFVSSLYFGADFRNILFCSVFFVTGGMIYLYRECIQSYVTKHRIVILCLLALGIAIYYFQNNTLTRLFICSVILMYALGINRGGGTAQSVYKIYQQYQLRNLSLPHGNIPCY